MKTILSTLILLISTMAFAGHIDSLKNYEKFLLGSWKADNERLKNITFMDNNMVSFTRSGKTIDEAYHKHYRIVDYAKESKTFSIEFLQKDLTSDQFKVEMTIKIKVLNDNKLVISSAKGKAIDLTREVRYHESR